MLYTCRRLLVLSFLSMLGISCQDQSCSVPRMVNLAIVYDASLSYEGSLPDSAQILELGWSLLESGFDVAVTFYPILSRNSYYQPAFSTVCIKAPPAACDPNEWTYDDQLRQYEKLLIEAKQQLEAQLQIALHSCLKTYPPHSQQLSDVDGCLARLETDLNAPSRSDVQTIVLVYSDCEQDSLAGEGGEKIAAPIQLPEKTLIFSFNDPRSPYNPNEVFTGLSVKPLNQISFQDISKSLL